MSALAFFSQIVGVRELGAALALIAWLGLCWFYLAPRRTPDPAKAAVTVDWLILHASQSGNARRIAEQLENCLVSADESVSLMALNDQQPARLAAYSQALLIISTHGDGAPPDNGAAFWRKAQGARPDLQKLNFALLALGDSQYARFCAFGRHLSEWLTAAGACPLLPLQEVDQLSTSALHQWQHQLGLVTGQRISLNGDFRRWKLLHRQLLNPGSPGAPAWLIRLQPPGDMPVWQAGDLVQLRMGNSVRSYSIASLPEEGALELIVRQVIRADGSLGCGSGWLCCHAQPGEEIEMQVLPNPPFRLPDSPSPCILIGAGTGLAGLRGLLRQQLRRGHHPVWLVFGERCRERDRWLSEELEPLAETGRLSLDRCFSHDPEHGEYVQHRLRARADQLRQWVDQGACIHVCGSQAGMGAAIHQSLQELLTLGQWQNLQQHGRYRRDLY